MANGAPEVFYRDIDDLGCYYAHIGNKWSHKKSAPSNQPLIPRPTPSWSGEGLPPVGLDVEAYWPRDTHPDWLPFNLSYYSERHVIAIAGGADKHYTRPEFDRQAPKFRPIRTDEQIAADERESEASKMAGIIATGDCVGSLDIERAYRLYDAGFRKQ
ncbi:MAG: hypothetical protein EXR84_14020 [Gammaproteobacteria bacterium]|nr:hypothetical protein [Gammaproteobacteria bacterium]